MKYVVAILTVLGVLAAAPVHAAAAFKWSCSDTGKNGKQCQISNTGDEPAGICMDVVKVCHDGDHVAGLCSSRLNPGETESKVVSGFAPKVKFLEKCYGTEFRNKTYM